MLVLIIIGLGGLALYLQVNIYLMDRRERSSLRDVGETVEAYDSNFERTGQRAPIVTHISAIMKADQVGGSCRVSRAIKVTTGRDRYFQISPRSI